MKKNFFVLLTVVQLCLSMPTYASTPSEVEVSISKPVELCLTDDDFECIVTATPCGWFCYLTIEWLIEQVEAC